MERGRRKKMIKYNPFRPGRGLNLLESGGKTEKKKN